MSRTCVLIPQITMPLAVLAPILLLIMLLILLSQLQSLLQEVFRLLHLRLAAPLFQLAPRNSAPQPLLAEARNAMLAVGFSYTHTRLYRDLCSGASNLLHSVDVYYHPERDVHALVMPASWPQAGQCFEVELSNTYIDGSSVTTLWRGSARWILASRQNIVVRAQHGDVHNLLQAHLRRRQHVASVRTAASDARLLARARSEQFLPELAQRGKVVPTDHQQYRLSLGSAMRIAGQSWRSAWWRRRCWRQLAQSRQKTAPELLQQAQQIVWSQRWTQMVAAQQSSWLELIPSVIIAVALLGVSALVGGAIAVAAAMAVLFLHVTGLVLLKAVAWIWQRWILRGKVDTRPHPIFAVFGLLARPLFGLAFAATLWGGLALGYFPLLQANYLHETLWFAVLLLAFYSMQLLPWRPFLGGQILDLLSSWSWLRLLLLASASLIAATAGLYFNRYPLLVLATLLALCLPRLWHQVRAAHLARRHAGAPPSTLLQALARVRLCSAHGRLALIHALAKQRQPLGMTASTFGLTLYASCAVLPGLLLLTMLLNYPSQTTAAWQRSQQLWHKADSAPREVSNKLAQRSKVIKFEKSPRHHPSDEGATAPYGAHAKSPVAPVEANTK